MKIYDVTTLGELLIDFTPYGVSDNGNILFEQNPGGAPANVLTSLAKFGNRTAFIGKVGNDAHGLFLRQTLNKHNIDTTGLVLDNNVYTTLAFVTLSDSGERGFSFARKPGADTCLTAEEVNQAILKNTKVLHVGSLSLTHEPSRSATLHAIEQAKQAGAVISYDPNYRQPLWDSEKQAMEQMRSLLPFVDIMKLSDEEAELLTDFSDPFEAAKQLCTEGLACVAVTLGSKGAIVCIGDKTSHVPGYSVNVVDTTGAGDAFWGGFLHGFIKSERTLQDITLEDAIEYAKYGNATAALCVQKRGGIPAMPIAEDVFRMLANSDAVGVNL